MHDVFLNFLRQHLPFDSPGLPESKLVQYKELVRCCVP